MKYAELKKLNRQALLEILVAQSRRIDELEGQLAEAKAALQERSIMMDDAAQSPKPHSRSTKYSKPRRQRQINTLRVFANPVHRSFTMGFLREKRRARYRHARFCRKSELASRWCVGRDGAAGGGWCAERDGAAGAR